MKLLRAVAVLIPIFIYGQEIPRQPTLDVVRKLQNTLHQLSQDSPNRQELLVDAKLRTSVALRNFHYSVLFIGTESLKEALEVEQQVLQYGQTVTDDRHQGWWCWENNLFLLEGAVGWLGNGYSECVGKLIRELKDIVDRTYGRLEDGDDGVNKYRLLEVFERKNIISNPGAISEAIDELHLAGNDANLDLGVIVEELKDKLDAMLLPYGDCLQESLKVFQDKVNQMKQFTEQCLKDL